VHAGWIARDRKGAAEIYLAANKVGVIKQPGSIFAATPQRSMRWAGLHASNRAAQGEPGRLGGFFFPAIHDRAGS
jgi:hypothetical protein